jgi:hypothetical protein
MLPPSSRSTWTVAGDGQVGVHVTGEIDCAQRQVDIRPVQPSDESGYYTGVLGLGQNHSEQPGAGHRGHVQQGIHVRVERVGVGSVDPDQSPDRRVDGRR